MSHPLPGHDYGEQTKHESTKTYKHRRSTALGRNKTQRMTARWLHEAGESLRGKEESPLAHLKRLSKGKALTAKMK